MGEVLITVNGEPTSAAAAELLLREEVSRGAADTPELREGVREALVRDALMAQAALAAGLHEQPEVRAQLELSRQNILARAWQQQLLQGQTVGEPELREAYASHLQALGPLELQVRHLVTRDAALAQAWLRRLQGGEDASAMASESIDQQSAGQGGAVGWTPVGRLHPGIAEALAALAPGEWSPQPVASPAGWHVLQLQARREVQVPEFNNCRQALAQSVAQERVMQALALLRERALIA